MMGRRQRVEAKLFYSNITLDSRVRADNPLRQIKAAIDFDFVRAAVKPLYGGVGNPSVDPAVLMKLMLLLVLDNIRSERELMARMSERLDWMWFCGYDFDSEIPNHSVISKARRRWGAKVFTELFQRVLHQCMEAGLVDGQTLHVDASVIRANAAKDTIHPALQLAAEALYDRLERDGAEESAAECPPASEPPAANQPACDPPANTAAVPPGTLVSSTDPDARLTRKNGQAVLGYKDHRVIDDLCGVITATVTTDAAKAESHIVDEALDQHQHNTGCEPGTLCGDKGYGTAAVYQSMAERGVKPCIPHQNHRGRNGVGIFETKEFRYDSGRDAYQCPQGHWLSRRCTNKDGSSRYQCDRGVCAACPQKSLCTRAKNGRRLTRDAGQEWIDWADGCYSRGHRRRLIGRRMYRAEGSFADAANRHGYKRARWRGLMGMTIQNLLIAAAQNIRKLIRVWRKKPPATNLALESGRHWPRFAGTLLHWCFVDDFIAAMGSIFQILHQNTAVNPLPR